MFKRALIASLLVAVALSGCGKNPAAAPQSEKSIKKMAGLKGKVPTASTAKTTTATKIGPIAALKGSTATPAPTTVAVDGEGALKVTIRTFGLAPATSAMLKLSSQADATQSVEMPVALTNDQGVWEQDEVPAGHFNLQVSVLDAKGAVMGVGNTATEVKNGEKTDLLLSVDISGAPMPTPVPTPVATPVATPTPDGGTSGTASSSTPTPAPTGPGWGGDINLRVQIF